MYTTEKRTEYSWWKKKGFAETSGVVLSPCVACPLSEWRRERNIILKREMEEIAEGKKRRRRRVRKKRGERWIEEERDPPLRTEVRLMWFSALPPQSGNSFLVDCLSLPLKKYSTLFWRLVNSWATYPSSGETIETKTIHVFLLEICSMLELNWLYWERVALNKVSCNKN